MAVTGPRTRRSLTAVPKQKKKEEILACLGTHLGGQRVTNPVRTPEEVVGGHGQGQNLVLRHAATAGAPPPPPPIRPRHSSSKGSGYGKGKGCTRSRYPPGMRHQAGHPRRPSGRDWQGTAPPTTSPTQLPTPLPTQLPTTTIPAADSCVDVDSLIHNGKTKDCEWVIINQRCQPYAHLCPVSCDQCECLLRRSVCSSGEDCCSGVCVAGECRASGVRHALARHTMRWRGKGPSRA